MYLSAYHFTGDPTSLLESHAKLQATFPDDSLDLHICAVTDNGIVVFDACPDRETSVRFSASDDFRRALASAGLPAPLVEHIGDVQTALLREDAASDRPVDR